MSRNVYRHYVEFLSLNSINHSILYFKPGRSVTLPFTSKRLVIESLDVTQAFRAGYLNNVLPLFVSLQDLCGKFSDFALDSPMLEDLPHIENSIYTILDMSRKAVGSAA